MAVLKLSQSLLAVVLIALLSSIGSLEAARSLTTISDTLGTHGNKMAFNSITSFAFIAGCTPD